MGERTGKVKKEGNKTNLGVASPKERRPRTFIVPRPGLFNGAQKSVGEKDKEKYKRRALAR